MDARTGYGKIIYKDGAEFEGYWRDGQLSDPVTTTPHPSTTTTTTTTTTEISTILNGGLNNHK